MTGSSGLLRQMMQQSSSPLPTARITSWKYSCEIYFWGFLDRTLDS